MIFKYLPQDEIQATQEGVKLLTIYSWKFIFNYLKVLLLCSIIFDGEWNHSARIVLKSKCITHQRQFWCNQHWLSRKTFYPFKTSASGPISNTPAGYTQFENDKTAHQKISFWILAPWAATHWVTNRKAKSTIIMTCGRRIRRPLGMY